VKQLLIALALVAAVALSPRAAQAHDAYSDAESHPLKIASYPVAVVGFALEWLLTRPIHFLVSEPTLQPVFNYEPSYNAFDSPEPYVPGRSDAPGRFRSDTLPSDAQVLTPPGQ
jgi:hypothetical protein